MAMMQLEARWAGQDDFVDVDFAASLGEAKTRAIEFQLEHNVRAPITWLQSDKTFWGQNKFCTFRLRPV